MEEMERRLIEEYVDPAWNLKINLPSIEISLLEGVYRPKLDSFLIAKVLTEIPLKGKRVLDVCTGCGILALIAAKRGASVVVAIDIDENSIKCTQYNSVLNHVVVDARLGNLYDPIKNDEKFDLIVANPPSLPTPPGLSIDEGYAGGKIADDGPDGRRYLDPLITLVPRYLEKGSYFLTLHGNFSNIEKSGEILEAEGFLVEITMYEYPCGKTSGERVSYFLDVLPPNCHPFKKENKWFHKIGVFKARKL